MKSIYMSVHITFYSPDIMAPACYYFESIDDAPMTRRELSLAEALKLQWELKKAGATREVHSNRLCPSISYLDVHYYATH